MSKIRLQLNKGEALRAISHLDYARALERALRRAGLPVAFSEGFNPHPKVSFASALALGTTSEAEYVDVELAEPVSADEVLTRLEGQLPPGMEVTGTKVILPGAPSLNKAINLARFRVTAPWLNGKAAMNEAAAAVADCLEAAEIIHVRKTEKKGVRTMDIRPLLRTVALVGHTADEITLCLEIHQPPNGSVKPIEVLRVLCLVYGLPADADRARIHREGLLILGEDGSVNTPLE